MNYLDIKLKVSDQEPHMLSNTPHWPRSLPPLLRYCALYMVITVLGKVCVILMHHRSPGFLQFHLRSFEAKQILEHLEVPRKANRSTNINHISSSTSLLQLEILSSTRVPVALELIKESSKEVIIVINTYLERTSWVKNSCKGQSTEYSRAIPSQPSRDISEEPKIPSA